MPLSDVNKINVKYCFKRAEDGVGSDDSEMLHLNNVNIDDCEVVEDGNILVPLLVTHEIWNTTFVFGITNLGEAFSLSNLVVDYN